MTETKEKFIAVEANRGWYVAEVTAARSYWQKQTGTITEEAAKLLAAAYNRGEEEPFDLPEIKAAIRGTFVAFEADNLAWYVAEVDAAGVFWRKEGTMSEEAAKLLAAAYNCGEEEPPVNSHTINGCVSRASRKALAHE